MVCVDQQRLVQLLCLHRADQLARLSSPISLCAANVGQTTTACGLDSTSLCHMPVTRTCKDVICALAEADHKNVAVTIVTRHNRLVQRTDLPLAPCWSGSEPHYCHVCAAKPACVASKISRHVLLDMLQPGPKAYCRSVSGHVMPDDLAA